MQIRAPLRISHVANVRALLATESHRESFLEFKPHALKIQFVYDKNAKKKKITRVFLDD